MQTEGMAQAGDGAEDLGDLWFENVVIAAGDQHMVDAAHTFAMF